MARLGNIRIPLQVDIGFGDPVTPAPTSLNYPVLLDFPSPTIRAYPPETVVAEKFHAMVRLGIVSSRMKDYFDIWILSGQFEFDGDLLAKAVAATFRAQRTRLPTLVPLALSEQFRNDTAKTTQWRAFVSRNRLETGGADLKRVVADLAGFLMPVVQATASGVSFRQLWQPGGPWKRRRGSVEG